MTIKEFTDHLRNEFSLKENTDYAYTYKYNNLHILCNEVWIPTIQEEAKKFNIEITRFHTYSHASFGFQKN